MVQNTQIAPLECNLMSFISIRRIFVDWKGKINFDKAITLKDKPHGIERETSLPTFDSGRDNGRVVFAEDTGKLWSGGLTEWKELTPGGVGDHSHDDKYYTETEIDNFFSGQASGKKQVDWSNIINKQTEYTPTSHNNDYHSEEYITASGVTAQALADTGSIGSLSSQVARGSHNHDGQYAPINPSADTITYDNASSSMSATQVQAALDELDSRVDVSEIPLEGIYWVDNTRTGTYTETGRISTPFKSISSAISYIGSGQGTIILSSGLYNESFILPSGISIKSLGQATFSIESDIVIGDGTSGDVVLENIDFTGLVTINMTDSLVLRNVNFYQESRLIVNSGNVEGEISIENANGQTALEIGGGVFYANNCSLATSGANTILQTAGELIISDSDVVGDTVNSVILSSGGTVNIADTRVFNAGSGHSITLNNDGNSTTPNILTNIYKKGLVDTGSSVTIISAIFGDTTGVTGSAHVYQPASTIGYNSSASELSASTIQSAIDQLANSHSEFEKTHMVYVDENRTDSYTPTGTIDRPFKDIGSAIEASVPGDTIKCFKGAYSVSSGDIVLPADVNLIGEGQGKTNFYSKVVTGATGKCRLEHASFRSGLEVNNDTFVHYIYCNTNVVFNAPVQGDGFSIEVDSGTPLTLNSGSSATLALNTIATTDDAAAVKMNNGCGALTLQTSKLINSSSTHPTLDSDGGTVVLLTANLINGGGGLAADLTNEATLDSPNMISQVVHVGDIDTDGTPTIVEGVYGGQINGFAISMRPATQIEYDNTSSGLSAEIVQDAIDEVVSMVGSGNAIDIVYSGSLDSTNVQDALDELDSEKSDISHSHNTLYYTKTNVDTLFVSKNELLDVTTHSERAAYQEVVLNSQTSTDTSGLTPGETYNFQVSIDGSSYSEHSITPDPATKGYQELGLSGLDLITETGLIPGTYDYKVRPNGNGLNTYTIEIDPATAASTLGTTDLTSGYDWGDYNKDFDIEVNGTPLTVNLTSNESSASDIANAINSEFINASVSDQIEAYESSGLIGLRTVNTGSGQTFTLSPGVNDGLALFGMSSGAYTGSDASSGYEEINLNGSAGLTSDTGLSTETTYDIEVSIDGGVNQNVSFEFSNATSGYQEFGLSGIVGSNESGLTPDTDYDLSVEVDGTPNTVTINLPSAEAQRTEITAVGDVSGSLSGAYFEVETPANSYYMWYNMQESPALPADSGLGTEDMSSGHDWSVGNEELVIDGVTVTLTQQTATLSGTTTHINNKIADAGITGIEAYDDGVSYIGLRTTSLGSGQSFTLSNGSSGSDAILTLGLTTGSYTGSDAVYSTEPTVAGTGVQIDIVKDDDAATVASKTSTAVGAVSDLTTYYSSGSTFEIENDAAGEVEPVKSGTTGFTLNVLNTGAEQHTLYVDLVNALSANTPGASWIIYNDDIRCTSDTTGSGSSISLSAGSSNDLLTALSAPLDPSVDGSDTEDTTFSTLLDNLNASTSGASWSLVGGNVRCTSDTSGLTSTIDLTQGVNDFVASLNGAITPYFTNNTNGTDESVAEHAGTEDMSSGYDFRNKSQTLVIDGYTSTLDANTTSLAEVVGLLNGKLESGLEAYESSPYVGVRTVASGATEQFNIESGSALGTLGLTIGAYSGTDKTNTTTSNILSLLNASTTASVTWSLVGGDIRCTYDSYGSASTIELQPGETNDLYAALGAVSPYNTAVSGTDSTDKFSDIVDHLNSVTTGATWTFNSGNLKITRDEIGSGYEVQITNGLADDVFINLNGFVEIGPQIVGLDTDTTTGSDLIGVQGITDITPEGKNSGDAGTLQEVLEAGVGQFHTSQPNPSPGRAWFDTSTNTLYVYNGSTWVGTTLS